MTVPIALVTSHSSLSMDPRVRRTVETLLEEGWEVRALVLDGPEGIDRLRVTRVPLKRKQGSTLRYLFEYGAFFLCSLAWITWSVLRRQVSLVYVNSPPDSLVFGAAAAKTVGIPVVLDVHDPMPELLTAKGRRSSFLRRLLEVQERWSLRFADRVITVHAPLRDLLEERSPGVSIDIVMNIPKADLQPLPRDPSSRLVVFAGTVANRYGLDDALDAVSRVRSSVPGLRFRIVGDGEDLEQLRLLADRLAVADIVEFVGRVPYGEIREAQKGAWAGINVPKPDELGDLSFSNKIVEWVAMRLPVVASRTRTLLTFFPEDTLIYVQPGSPQSIADGLLRLHRLSDTELEGMLARAAAALDRIAWSKQRAELVRVINELAPGNLR